MFVPFIIYALAIIVPVVQDFISFDQVTLTIPGLVLLDENFAVKRYQI